MRASEFIREDTAISQGPGIKQAQKTQLEKPGSKLIGKGEFAKVYTNPSDIETTVKVSSLNKGQWDLDGYYQFIEKVKDITDKTQNPYLPQIYNIERIQPRGKSAPYLKVEVEKLFPSSSLSNKEGIAVFEKLINRPVTNQDLDFLHNKIGVHWKTGEQRPIIWEWAIRNVMQAALSSESFGGWEQFVIKDPNLKEALAIVRRLIDSGYVLDLHDENYMIRRTPYGPQIVLTDPLSFKKQEFINISTV